MKHVIRTGLFFTLAFTTSLALAAQDQISDGLRLRRMSLLLRGYLPSAADIAALNATPESGREAFFQRKLKDYTSDILFRRKFAWRTKSLFRLEQDSRLTEEQTLGDFNSVTSTAPPDDGESDKQSPDALTKLLAQEKSWDDLMSSPAFAYQRALREAHAQVQLDLESRLVRYYSDVIPLFSDKSESEALARIRSDLKGEKPITIQEIHIPANLLEEAETWNKLLAKYEIHVKVNTSTPWEALNTLKMLNSALSNFAADGRDAVVRLPFDSKTRRQPAPNGPDSPGPTRDDFRVDLRKVENSEFRNKIRDFLRAQDIATRRGFDLPEIILKSSLMDRLLEAAEETYLSNKRNPPRGSLRDILDREFSRDNGLTRRQISRAEIAKSLEAAAIKLWEEGRFQTGLPLILSGDLRERYNQTKYSSSAAFYRIYFCDEMKAVALAKDDELSKLANGRLRFENSVRSQAKVKTAEQRHGSDPLCQGCHRKLDPIQKIADENGNVSGEIKIVYDDENGKEQSFTANSPAELIRQIKSQRMYQICQVRRFWNWYIGEDVPLTGQRLEQMLTSYRNHKSITEFVRTVVSQPEFSRIPQVTDKLTFEGVRPILSRCNDCHSTEALMPSFTQTPFALYAKGEEARAEHVDWLRKIVKITDLVHGAKNAKMPPKEAGWTLDESAVHQLARWVYFLAPDVKGQPTITSTQRDQILADASPEFLEKISLDEVSKPSFRSTYRRYLEGLDFIKVVHQIFQAPATIINQACGETFSQKRFAFGWFDHMTGGPTTLAPGGDFQMTWAKCLELVFTDKYQGKMSRSAIQGEIQALGEILRRESQDGQLRYQNEIFRRLGLLQRNLPASAVPYNGSLSPLLSDAFLKDLRQVFIARNQDYVDAEIPTETLMRRLAWSRLNPQTRSDLVVQLVQFAYPAGVFPQSTIAEIRSDLYKTMDRLSTEEKLDLFETMRSGLILLLSREEFLTL
ncbi:MAG: hypothetical protein AB7G93_05805 [Bdellovibrionales bacterium]